MIKRSLVGLSRELCSPFRLPIPIRGFSMEKEYQKEIEDIHRDYEERMKRRQALIGTVVSNKCSKSITVQIVREKYHPKYKMSMSVRKKIMAHDEEERGNVGDLVRIVPCRPMSRKKRHTLIDILRKGKVFEAPNADSVDSGVSN